MSATIQAIEALAQEIRRVNGNHSLGAAELAEALMPFISSLRSSEVDAPEAKGLPEDVVRAAQAVIDRWETPLWKDSEPTAGFIYELRNAVERYRALSRVTGKGVQG